MSEFLLILVLRKENKQKLWYDMAKIQIKSEKLTPFRIFVCSRCLLRVSWTKISLKSFCYLNGMDHISSGEVTFRCSWNVMVKFLEDKGEVVGRIRICLWKILSRRSHNSCCALAHQLMCTCIPRVVQSSISWCAAILHKMLCLCSQTPTFFYSICSFC